MAQRTRPPTLLTSSLSIIIPAYNEETRLPATLQTVTNYLAQRDFSFLEILVVDDGSRDGTAAVAERFPGVRVLKNPGNRGKGYAVRHGMLEARGEWLLFSDADLSTPIEELEKLCAAVDRESAAIAIGSRALDRSLIGVHQSVFRERAGQVFNFAMRAALGLDLHDTQCGFKLYHRDAARAIFRRQLLERFGFDAEVLFIARKLGYKMLEIPVRWNNVEGTKVSMLNGAQPFIDLLTIRYNAARGLYRWDERL
jgi:dolichyl-phosphate beta-glucosyltransferase